MKRATPRSWACSGCGKMRVYRPRRLCHICIGHAVELAQRQVMIAAEPSE